MFAGTSNELLSAPQVAARLQVHRVTAAALVRSGRLAAVKVGDRWVVRRDVLEEFAKGYDNRRGRRKRPEPGGAT